MRAPPAAGIILMRAPSAEGSDMGGGIDCRAERAAILANRRCFATWTPEEGGWARGLAATRSSAASSAACLASSADAHRAAPFACDEIACDEAGRDEAGRAEQGRDEAGRERAEVGREGRSEACARPRLWRSAWRRFSLLLCRKRSSHTGGTAAMAAAAVGGVASSGTTSALVAESSPSTALTERQASGADCGRGPRRHVAPGCGPPIADTTSSQSFAFRPTSPPARRLESIEAASAALRPASSSGGRACADCGRTGSCASRLGGGRRCRSSSGSNALTFARSIAFKAGHTGSAVRPIGFSGR